MKNTIHKLCLALSVLFMATFTTIQAQNVLGEARIYINPGHGGWGSNDRPQATINYAVLDTLGFFETNTNLLKGLSLYKELENAGAGFLKITRNRNGVATDATAVALDSHREGDVIEGVTQMVTLSVICADVEANNMDYFLSIHSNAATEAAITNYPLLLYRGTDAAVGNGLVEAKNMGLDAWKYIVDNQVSYHSHYTLPTQSNVRGDITFMGSSTTSLGYTGYYGVLRHGCDGFLSEGCFHTYNPERHRLLNPDYCRQEGVRYSRAIRAWFGDNTETKGDIMGTVKDKYKSLEHNLYHYAANSIDAHYPLNEVTVVLKNSAGTQVGQYTTDKEYNGIYVFTDLEPGTYTLVYDFPGTEYIPATEQIEVVANKTAFINMLVADTETPPPYPFLDPYYPNPVQSGDIAAPESFVFEKDTELLNIAALNGLTIRRAILRDNKYYVLGVDATKAPKLLVINPATGDLIKEMSTQGLSTEGHQGKKHPYILSDISFTNDGVLIGTNSTVVGVLNNMYQTGDFYIYKWQASENTALEDAEPEVITKLTTNVVGNASTIGNNNSNFLANSIAVKGNIDDFYIYFDSHAGDNWTTDYYLILVSWRITGGQVAAAQYNSTQYYSTYFKDSFRMAYSPFGDIKDEADKAELHRLILDGNITAPIEFRVNWSNNAATEIAKFTENIPVESSGINYFRYLNKVYMSTVVCEKQTDDTYYNSAHLYDVTNGLNQAVFIGSTDAVITDTITYMATAGVVDNANINLYLLAGDNIVKFKSINTTGEKIARIFASALTSSKTGSGYDFSYILNENADDVKLILTDAVSGAEVKTIALTGMSKGNNTVTIPMSEIPENSQFTWSIKASAGNITRFVKLSDDSESYRFFGPKGIAIDKSTESKHFGRVYVTNSDAGENAGRTTSKGIYILGADGSDITNQGNNAYTGSISWDATTTGVSPRKVAVAADGRVFVSDYSLNNSGIYYMNPETFQMAPVFEGATRETTYGKLTVGGTYVGGRTGGIGVYGEGANTRIYGVDRSVANEVTWWKNVNTYNIGENNTWSTAPSSAGRSTSYFGNDNTSLVPVEGGYWGGQFRGATSQTAGNPIMFYYSNADGKSVYNTYDSWTGAGSLSSENGALGVNEKEKVIAVAYNGGAAVFTYTMDGNKPVVKEKFLSALESKPYDDFGFDYAGNLYAISYSAKLLSVWAMPTDNNTCITPAPKSMIICTILDGSPNIEESTGIKLYPNPVKDFCVIESDKGISLVEVYTNTGMLIDKINTSTAKSVTLNTSRYPNGIYIVKVNNEKTLKVVKN